MSANFNRFCVLKQSADPNRFREWNMSADVERFCEFKKIRPSKYATHETYLDQLIVLPFTEPLSIGRHMSLTKPIWIGWFLETHKSLSISRHISLTKPVWIGCLFCLSQNLSASADTHKTMFEFGGLWFECYLGWHKLAQHGTFMKWFKQPSWSLCQSDLPPDPARLVTGALQSLKFCPPNSNVELCVSPVACTWLFEMLRGICSLLTQCA